MSDEDEATTLDSNIKLFDPDSVNKFIEKQFKRQGAPIKDVNSIVEFLTRRSVLPESAYHLFMPNEISLANLTRDELELLDLHMKVIDQGIYMAKRKIITWDIPLMDAVEFLSWLNGTRAIGMKHEELMAVNTVHLRREETVKPASMMDQFRKPRQ